MIASCTVFSTHTVDRHDAFCKCRSCACTCIWPHLGPLLPQHTCTHHAQFQGCMVLARSCLDMCLAMQVLQLVRKHKRSVKALKLSGKVVRGMHDSLLVSMLPHLTGCACLQINLASSVFNADYQEVQAGLWEPAAGHDSCRCAHASARTSACRLAASAQVLHLLGCARVPCVSMSADAACGPAMQHCTR